MKTVMCVLAGALLALFCVIQWDPYLEPELLPIAMILSGVLIGYVSHELEHQVEKYRLDRNVRRFIKERDQENKRAEAERRLRSTN